MSDYTKTTDFAAKDALTTGNANKVVSGTELDDEFNNLSTAIATKFDNVSDVAAASEVAAGVVELATTTEVITGTDTSRAVTPAGVEAWSGQNAGMVQDISNLADPGADRLLGWDDSAGAVIGFTATTGAVLSGTSLTVDHDAATNFVANEHINHSSVDIIAGNGLTGGGDLTADRTLTIGTPGTITASSTNAVTSTSHTHAIGSGIVQTAPGTGGQITVSTSAASGAATNGDMWLQV
jgi:hypothetical protein